MEEARSLWPNPTELAPGFATGDWPPCSVLRVVGAGSAAANGYYVANSEFNGKPEYHKVDEAGNVLDCASPDWVEITWLNGDAGAQWKMCTTHGHYYKCCQDTGKPPAGPWQVGDKGVAPCPRVEFRIQG